MIVRYVAGGDPITYPIAYNANGATAGSVPTSQTKTQDVALVLAGNTGNLARTGYTFAGWNTASDGSATNYATGASYSSNAALTLYATWMTDRPAGCGLQIANVNWTNAAVSGQSEVSFNIHWGRSWRAAWTQEAASAAIGKDLLVQSWDAAWVFVKFRPANSPVSYSHATLSANSSDHIVPNGVGGVVMTNECGLSEGKGMGVFIYRAAAGQGANDISNVRLRWLSQGDGVASGAYDVQVHGIEMVYVDQGPFALGSANGVLGTEGGSVFYAADMTNQPFLVTNEAAIVVSSSPVAGNLWAKGNIEASVLSNAYPKGYAAFYCMKHEISQGQYADFLNSLLDVTAETYCPNKQGIYRFTIGRSNGVYVASRPDRACNYLTWRHGSTYAAWAGLRPLSELELAKACRGPLKAVANEYAWGTPSIWNITWQSGVGLSGAENGLESVTSYVTNTGAAIYLLGQQGRTIKGGDGGNGPIRAGIFATTNSSRVDAGATYWGILDVVCSLSEPDVTIANGQGRRFQGSHGAGTLTLPSDWPEKNAAGSGALYGGWMYESTAGQMPRRSASSVLNNAEQSGMRCARTALSAASTAGVQTNSYGPARFRGGPYDGSASAKASVTIPAQLYVQNLPASAVADTAATLNGRLVEAGPSAATVSVFWGTANGGVNRAAWANTNVWSAGAWTNNTCPSLALTGLAPSTTYYYTFGATNSSGSVIATPSTSFTTCEAANGPVITLK